MKPLLRPFLLGLVWVQLGVSTSVWAVRAELKFDGLSSALEKNARLHLSLKENTEYSSSDFEQNRLRLTRELEQALIPFGFYQSKISVSTTQDQDTSIIQIEVTLPPPVIWKQIELEIIGEGATDAALLGSFEDHKPKLGQILLHTQYKQLKNRLLNTAFERGYLDAEFSQAEVKVNVETGSAYLTWVLTTGPQYYYGPIIFEQDKFQPEFLQRFVQFQIGEPYRLEKLAKLQRTLQESNLFERVQIEAKFDSAQDLQIPIHIKLIEKQKWRYGAGVGFGTDTGPRGSFELENRRINRRGHQLGFEASASGIRDYVTGVYSIPLARPQSDFFRISLEWSQEQIEDKYTEIQRVRLQRNRGLSDYWTQSLFLKIQEESFELLNEQGELFNIIPGANRTYLKYDQASFVVNGHRFFVQLQGSGQFIVSESEFLQVLIENKWIQSWRTNQRMIFKTSVGASWAPTIEDIPLGERFFVGGDQTVRGFAFESLAPQDSSGQLIGGRHLFTATIEDELRIKDKWSLALFMDAGNTFLNTPTELAYSLGFGLRWQTPVGLIRMDLANALSEPDNPWRFHINIGPDF